MSERPRGAQQAQPRLVRALRPGVRHHDVPRLGMNANHVRRTSFRWIALIASQMKEESRGPRPPVDPVLVGCHGDHRLPPCSLRWRLLTQRV